MDWKCTDFQIKKKFWALQSVKKVILAVCFDLEEPMNIDFFEKDATVNSASCC